MRKLITAALACLAGLSLSVLAIAAPPPDDYNVGLDAGMEISRTLLGSAFSAGIKGCQDQALFVTMAGEAKARSIPIEEVAPVFDSSPAGAVARRVYAGEIEPHPAALEHINTCLTQLRAKLE